MKTITSAIILVAVTLTGCNNPDGVWKTSRNEGKDVAVTYNNVSFNAPPAAVTGMR